jgi:TonB family protein
MDAHNLKSPDGTPESSRPEQLSTNSGPGNPTAGPAVGLFLADSIYEPWFKSFARQIGELFQKPEALPPLPRFSEPTPGSLEIGPMLIDSTTEPWFHSIIRHFKDEAADKKLPPLQVTSKPVSVKSIWGFYDFKRQGVSSSAAVHVLFILLVFGVFGGAVVHSQATGTVTLVIPVDISPYLMQITTARPTAADSGGGGGGGQRSPLPPSKGKLPRFSMEQLTPPVVEIRNENPKLAVEPTVLVPPDVQVPNINMAVFGDPMGQIGPPSAGPGSGGGIGTGRGTGVGSGRGPGVGPGSGGGIGGGVFRIGGGVSAPRLTYKVEPEYSEEARKAKYQGTVVLQVEVHEDGKAHNIRIVRSLGLGLDEKAVQAVEQWKFVERLIAQCKLTFKFANIFEFC